MAISQDGWFDWCERVPGPADKVYSAENTCRMFLPHSAVGFYGGWAGRLFSQERRPDGRYTPYAAASVQLWFPQSRNVRPKQHYSLLKSCWASGSLYPNTNGVAAENEGGYQPENEPLTAYQVELNVRAIEELSAWKGWTPRRPRGDDDKTATLYEHNECVRWGSEPTACPSNRIPWMRIMQSLKGESPMTPAELERIKRLERNLLSVAQDTAAWQAQAEAVVGKLARDIATDGDLAALGDLRGRIEKAAAALGGEG